MLAGRIVTRRRITTSEGAIFLTVLKLPAVDEYSSPATVELRSAAELGAPGESWCGRVQVGGFARSYDVDNEVTGRKDRVQTANNTLRVVEG